MTSSISSTLWSLPILMYHAVPPSVAAMKTPIDVPHQEFLEQLRLVADRGWQVVGVSRALELLAVEPESRVLALTIDDGYADLPSIVSALADCGFGGTAYIPTDFLDGRAGGRFAHPPMTWETLRELAEVPGIEIGSHTRQHRPLDVMQQPEVVSELRHSGDRLSQEIQREVRSISYPYGYATPGIADLARRVGYTSGCVIGRQLARRDHDPLLLPRVQPMPKMPLVEFERMIDRGESGPVPTLKRVMQSPWRSVRRIAQLTGRELT